MSLTPPSERVWWKEPIAKIELTWIAIATTIATIGFGWHYAIDAVGGAALAKSAGDGRRVHGKGGKRFPCCTPATEQRHIHDRQVVAVVADF